MTTTWAQSLLAGFAGAVVSVVITLVVVGIQRANDARSVEREALRFLKASAFRLANLYQEGVDYPFNPSSKTTPLLAAFKAHQDWFEVSSLYSGEVRDYHIRSVLSSFDEFCYGLYKSINDNMTTDKGYYWEVGCCHVGRRGFEALVRLLNAYGRRRFPPDTHAPKWRILHAECEAQMRHLPALGSGQSLDKLFRFEDERVWPA
jgi:hypothetical protein